MPYLLAWVLWGFVVAVNPTVGAAIVAGIAGVVNTAILMRHERRMNARLDERRMVVAHLDRDAIVVTEEERRDLELDPPRRYGRHRDRKHRREDEHDPHST